MNGDSKRLQFSNSADLKKASSLDAVLRTKLHKLDCNDCLVRVKELISNAAKASREGNFEQQFSLLFRTCEVAELLRHKNGFKDFTKKSPDKAEVFKKLYTQALSSLEGLQTKLDSEYDQQNSFSTKNRAVNTGIGAAPKEAPQKKIVSQPSVSDYVNKKTISPKDLIRALENQTTKSKSALIIDYRFDRPRLIKYPRPHFIEVIQVPADIIKSGLIFNTLSQQLDVGVRSKLHQLQKYDLVVIMEEKSPAFSPNGDLVINSKANILSDALFTYNQNNCPKNKPLVMEGGFDNWHLQYPTYTETASKQKTDEVKARQHRIQQMESQYGIQVPPVIPISYEEVRPQPATKISPHSQPGPGAYPSLPPERPAPPSSVNGAPSSVSTSISSDLEVSVTRTAREISPRPQQQQEQDFGPFPPPPAVPVINREAKPVVAPERHIPSIDRSKKPEYPAVLGGEGKYIDGQRDTQGFGPTVHDAPARPSIDRSTKPDSHSEKEHLLSIYKTVGDTLARSVSGVGPGTPGRCGLYNMGNTCFMNAILQCLFQTPGLRECFGPKFINYVNVNSKMGTEGRMAAVFAALMSVVWEGRCSKIRPTLFLEWFSQTVNPSFGDGQQHDAQELQMFLLDALHEDTNRVTKRIPFEQNYEGGEMIGANGRDFLEKSRKFSSSPINDIFNLLTVSELRCLECNKRSATFEQASLVSLELPQYSDRTHLNSCFASHFSDTILEDDCRWNCPNCRRPQRAQRTTTLWDLPSVMVVHLKRFSITNGDYTKNAMPVEFSLNLDVGKYLHKGSPARGRGAYELYAITYHRGRLNSGHYTAVAKHATTRSWIRFDDETTTEVGTTFDTSDAFMLYYKRVDLDTKRPTLV